MDLRFHADDLWRVALVDLLFHADHLLPQMVNLIELTVNCCAVEGVDPLAQLHDLTPKTVALGQEGHETCSVGATLDEGGGAVRPSSRAWVSANWALRS